MPYYTCRYLKPKVWLTSTYHYNKNFIYFYGYDCLKKDGLSGDDLKSKLKNGAYYLLQYWDFKHEKLNKLKQFLTLFYDAGNTSSY